MSRQTTPPQSLQSQSDLPKGTPASKKQSGYDAHSSTIATRDVRFKDMWSEIHTHVVGPMPVEDFLTRFLRPEPSEVLPNQLKAPGVSSGRLKAYVDAAKEKKYETLIAALQPTCSNLEFKDTHHHPLTAFRDFKISPDICVVNRGRSRVDITKAEIFMELKSYNHDDPFNDGVDEPGFEGDDEPDSKEYFVKKTDAGQKTFGQTTVYAAAHQAAQFRTHIFSVLVFPQHSRLLRWDRSGVIVTKKLPTLSPLFIEFFHLYDHATLPRRGIDMSVSNPSPDNASKARISLGISSKLPLVQLSLEPSSKESFIVSREIYMSHTRSPLGRSTRTFIAYSISDQCNYFLKDSWRLESQTPEHEIYNKLYSRNVSHIPTVVGGGDILDHTTLTQDILEESPEWIRTPPERLRRHRHYRLVLKEIATPLHMFSSTKLLVTAIHDAMLAHRAAYFDAGIFHRDISAGNIMIYKKGGLLLDWDLSKSTQDQAGARELARTGTWQFISARLLREPTVLQSHIDDVESFVHVITWVSVQYAKHEMPPNELRNFMVTVFDHSFHATDGFTKGGDGKAGHLRDSYRLEQASFDSPNLKNLLKKTTKTISIRYTEAPLLSGDALGDPDEFKVLQKNHEKRLAILDDPMWMISEFASALALPNWPIEDGAEDRTKTTGDKPSGSKKSKPNWPTEDGAEDRMKTTGDKPSGSKRSNSDLNDGAARKRPKLRSLASGSGRGK